MRERQSSCTAGARRLGCVGQRSSSSRRADATRRSDGEAALTALRTTSLTLAAWAARSPLESEAPAGSLGPNAASSSLVASAAGVCSSEDAWPDGIKTPLSNASSWASASACSARATPFLSSDCKSNGMHRLTASAAACGVACTMALSSLPPATAPAPRGLGVAHKTRTGVSICATSGRGSLGVGLPSGGVGGKTSMPYEYSSPHATASAARVTPIASSQTSRSISGLAGAPPPPASRLNTRASCDRIAWEIRSACNESERAPNARASVASACSACIAASASSSASASSPVCSAVRCCRKKGIASAAKRRLDVMVRRSALSRWACVMPFWSSGGGVNEIGK
eukprot:scaffold4116_cov27-Tisochrysis_lutea.AAC.1